MNESVRKINTLVSKKWEPKRSGEIKVPTEQYQRFGGYKRNEKSAQTEKMAYPENMP